MCVSVLDSNVLVQRNTLEVILFFFPFYTALVRGLFWYCHMRTLCGKVSSVKPIQLLHLLLPNVWILCLQNQWTDFAVSCSLINFNSRGDTAASQTPYSFKWRCTFTVNIAWYLEGAWSIQAWETAYGKKYWTPFSSSSFGIVCTKLRSFC